MGRNRRNGLDYFPFDVDLFQDIRIRKLIKYQSGKAITVYALLLCIIYKDGYYVRWDKELPFIISEQTGFEEAYILEVINSCLKLGLFNNELYASDGILTSKGIQERYKKICDLCRRNSEISEFSLISSEDNAISSEEKHINSEETAINSAKSTQSKEKKSKEKEILKKEPPKGGEKEKMKVENEELTDEFKNFLDWVDKETPCLKKIQRQITQKEYYKMKEKYNKKQITDVLTKIDNYKDAPKKYTSVYRTFLDWARKDYGG
jgi:hypothetical protein